MQYFWRWEDSDGGTDPFQKWDEGELVEAGDIFDENFSSEQMMVVVQSDDEDRKNGQENCCLFWYQIWKCL